MTFSDLMTVCLDIIRFLLICFPFLERGREIERLLDYLSLKISSEDET